MRYVCKLHARWYVVGIWWFWRESKGDPQWEKGDILVVVTLLFITAMFLNWNYSPAVSLIRNRQQDMAYGVYVYRFYTTKYSYIQRSHLQDLLTRESSHFVPSIATATYSLFAAFAQIYWNHVLVLIYLFYFTKNLLRIPSWTNPLDASVMFEHVHVSHVSTTLPRQRTYRTLQVVAQIN